jgi:Clp amino terminal domain, pathogenicity island component
VTTRQTEIRGEAVFNPWRTYIAAREEARSRGDRRVGTEHLLVALLLEPELASALGTDVEAARAGLATLDRQALAAVGVGAQIEVPAPPTGLVRRPTLKAVLQRRLPLTPVAKKVLEVAWKATRGRRRLGEQYLLASLLELERPDPAAALLAHLGVDPATAGKRLDRV